MDPIDSSSEAASEINPFDRFPELACFSYSKPASKIDPVENPPESTSEKDPIDDSPDPAPCSVSQEFQDLLKSFNKCFGEIETLLKKLTEHTERLDKTVERSTAERSNNFVNSTIKIFKESKDIDLDTPIRIFKVPVTLTSTKPEAYVPQIIGIGPIHHLRPELQRMQMYKVVEATRIHKNFKRYVHLDFGKVVEVLKTIAVPSVRVSYNIYLEMEDDVLACIMAVDGLFLLTLLFSYEHYKEALGNSISSGGILAQKTTIREAMMLESQIPILVLKVILAIEYAHKKDQKSIVSNLFPNAMLSFCVFVSPLKTVENYPPLKALKHAHLLDLLYHLVTLKSSPETDDDKEERHLEDLCNKVNSAIRVSKVRSNFADKAINLSKVFAPPEFQKPIEVVQGLLQLPWSQVRSSIASALKEEVPEKEIFIPRAWKLHKAGVKFDNSESDGRAVHITDINFKQSPEIKLHLPKITIKANFEVIIRNLVAYEAMIKSETKPPILNWYVELMNGLIQTAEDVKVLKNQGIIEAESINDEQITKIFSGMNKLVELTNIPKKLNDAVRDAKEYYNHVWWVSTIHFMKKCRRSTEKWFTIFATLLALFLLAVQSFCSVYQCPRFSFKISNTSQVQQGGLPLPSLRSHLM